VLANFKKIREKDIVVFGRSMGSGPSIHIGSTRSPAAVITMSAYTSIKNVVSEKMKILGSLVAEHFNNIEKVKSITP
jgi:esterase/lipase